MSDPKKSAWDGYRRWRNALWISILIGVVLGGAVMLLEMDFGIVILVLPIFAFLTFLQYFKCPQCDDCFCYKPRFLFPACELFAPKCVHCGLSKWEEPSPKSPKVEIYPISLAESPRPDPVVAERLRLAKFLTLVLRDDPKSICLRLDANGWADVGDLLKRANCNGIKLTRENLSEVLTVSESHRFELVQPGDRIRWGRI